MKSWSIWKRRRATKTRTSSSCLASGEVGTGPAGPRQGTADLWVRMPWAAAELVVPGGQDPCGLTAVVSGGTAQSRAQFRLRVSAGAACVSMCSPVCLLSCKGSQQNCCCSRNRCGVAHWPSLWLGENRWAAKKKKKGSSACLETNLQLPPQNR